MLKRQYAPVAAVVARNPLLEILLYVLFVFTKVALKIMTEHVCILKRPQGLCNSLLGLIWYNSA